MKFERHSTRPICRAIFRASFRGLKLKQFGVEKIVQCELDVELRPLSRRSDLYGIFSMVTDARLVKHGYCLREAKNAAAEMFQEQLTPWEESKICFTQ